SGGVLGAWMRGGLETLDRLLQSANLGGVADTEEDRLRAVGMVAKSGRMKEDCSRFGALQDETAFHRAGPGGPDALCEFAPGFLILRREVLEEWPIEYLCQIVLAKEAEPGLVASQHYTIAPNAQQTTGLLLDQQPQVAGFRRIERHI